jgi:RNA recognition motif-containing protein|eukprot:TRINITY_DN76125_c0_g1_i1.p1 TRINITY_DN76125_c0_g1~~TRINITY_DN76125_c0_g1_i1.p1  ORF type:complete len:412 (+),score=52.35 TRINITY_DN76125_c0_g1_i1:48-1283(+)
MSKKLFVGSLPHGVSDVTLRATFEQYGQVEDVFIKPNCEVGRQWAFVTFASAEQCRYAKECCDQQLTFPGADRPCDVMIAKNQGMFGQGSVNSTPAPVAQQSVGVFEGPKKIFVGSLPDNIMEEQLRSEFSKYGSVTDVFVKPGCEPGRQWAFVSFLTAAEAQHAKVSTDRILMFPGSVKTCEVTLARNQGMFGQEAIAHGSSAGSYQQSNYMQPLVSQPPRAAAPQSMTQGARKIFVGSLPDHVNEGILRSEFEKFGQITDIFIKTGCEPGRQWAFVTFATHEQAAFAKDSTDRTLILSGADSPCEVMLARNQGKFGQDPVASTPAAGVVMPLVAMAAGGQPPPPTAPPPAHLTPWRCYYTAAGLPYYHNHSTGVTQWEAPPELSTPAGASGAYGTAGAGCGGQMRYSPY